MISNTDLKRYNKKYGYSYSFGSFPTFELLLHRPRQVEKILIHSLANMEIRAKVEALCQKNQAMLIESDHTIERIREKDSCLLIGVFRKYETQLEPNTNHIMLVNPSDMGNIGTIIRTSVGFGIYDLAIVEPAADIFNPKVIRASMGSLFNLRFHHFPSFEEYSEKYGVGRYMYPFMLKGAKRLGTFECNPNTPFTLIFGNESTGLDDSYLQVGQSVSIQHTANIDSLNLSLATGIGIYEFTKQYFNFHGSLKP